MTVWRVMLKGEDGIYCLADNIADEREANKRAERLARNYDDRAVFVEPYERFIY